MPPLDLLIRLSSSREENTKTTGEQLNCDLNILSNSNFSLFVLRRGNILENAFKFGPDVRQICLYDYQT